MPNIREDWENNSAVLEDAADIYEQKRKMFADELLSTLEVSIYILKGQHNLLKDIMIDLDRDYLTNQERTLALGKIAILCEEIYNLDQLRAAFEWDEEGDSYRV